MRNGLAALAVLFLLSHLFVLPPTLEDVDSVNFALGVRDFDVARHQPHPPGYPVFIALGKAVAAVVNAASLANPEPRALSALSAMAGALLIPLLFALFRRLGADDTVGWWAMAAAVCSPLFWFTALRPLSDMTGLAFATASQCLLLAAWFDDGRGARRAVLVGAALSGLAAGVRVQTAVLTVPLLLLVVLWPRVRLSAADRGAAFGAAALGVLVWAVPLVIASGGLDGYLAALGTQAGEDFSGVVMLWTTRQARVAVDAVLNTFVWPWTDVWSGVGVVAMAAAGAARLAWRQPERFALLAIAFVPYALFHLLFHETATMRYALPILPAVAFLAVYASAALGRIGAAIIAAVLVVGSLVQTLPAARAYALNGSPAFQLFEEIKRAPSREGGGTGQPNTNTLAMHAAFRRVEDWEHDRHPWRVIRAPHGHEWLALVQHWRANPTPVLFAADPRRTDLVLFDPQARRLDASVRWSLREIPFVAGTRPGNADGYSMRPPGWMLDRGWALTAEIGGVTEKDGAGPHLQPSVAWIRSRPAAADLIIGGRHLGPASEPRARVTLSNEAGPIDSWEISPGFFFRRVALPAGALAGSGYVPLRVASSAADGSGRMVRVSLEQFDLQPDGIVMFGFLDGWHEPEYNPKTAQAWRWISEHGRLWIRPVGRDVTLTLTGESPLKYFDRAPTVKITAAGVVLAQFAPPADFTQRITIPANALATSGGVVTVDSELWFSPADRGGPPDKRHLALRMFGVAVN